MRCTLNNGHVRFSALLFLLILTARCTTSIPDEIEEVYSNLPEKVDYNFHIKPILSDRCYQCHGPDENTRKGGLRLDKEEEAFARLVSGNTAFVKGNAGRSAVFHRIFSEDPDLMMPPPDSKLSLTSEEKALLVKWLDQGAEWKPHWSFIEVDRPDVPKLPDPLASTVVNPIDNYIFHRLQGMGMAPSVEADKARLLRRVTMDLTGLPPTLEETEAFIKDNTAGAYERVVDRLLRTSDHAERLAMEWLDIARYSDSHGVSFDGARNSWPYRDWVIEAFRSNMPYDQFITEQVAGDMLENASDQQKIATSFLRMGQLEVSQGSIPEEFRVEYVAERTGLTGTAFLGLTVECARCHDHKFDPISQKEFYQLSAFFNTTEEMGLGPTDDDRPPTIYLFDEQEKSLLDSLNDVIEAHQKGFQTTRNEVAAIKEYAEGFSMPDKVENVSHHYAFEVISPYKKKRKKRKKQDKDEFDELQKLDNNIKAEAMVGVTLAEGKVGKAAYFDDEYDYLKLLEVGLFDTHDPYSASAWIKTERSEKGPTQTIMGNSKPYISDYRGWDLFLDSTMQLHARLIHRLPDDYLEVMVPGPVEANRWVHVGFTYDGSSRAEGLRLFINGELRETTQLFDQLTRNIQPVDDYTFKADTSSLVVGRSNRKWTFDVGLFEGAIDEINLLDRKISAWEMALLAGASREPTLEEVMEYQLLQNDLLNDRYAVLNKARRTKRSILDTVAEVMVMEEMKNPRKTYLLERGLYNQHGEVVEPGTPQQVLAFTEEYPGNRLGLAAWLTDERNPLTARVAINRYWQMIFGRGLVKTAEDFGSQGEQPSHPALLDWLASEFMASSWDLRHMMKLMVMSATYRQSSYASPEMMEQDPSNTYYARGSSYRWPAEFIRDNLLAASGLLVKQVGGPPVKPYQPEGLWKELTLSSYVLKSYKQDTLGDLYRRSLYTFQRRFMPAPFMATFDASSREICLIRRDITNSPLQALILLNDPQVLEASRVLSERILQSSPSLDEQLTTGYKLATGIDPSSNQLRLLKAQYQETLAHFESHSDEADSLLSVGEMPWNRSLDKHRIAAMSIVTNTIFNYDETYMKR